MKIKNSNCFFFIITKSRIVFTCVNYSEHEIVSTSINEIIAAGICYIFAFECTFGSIKIESSGKWGMECEWKYSTVGSIENLLGIDVDIC